MQGNCQRIKKDDKNYKGTSERIPYEFAERNLKGIAQSVFERIYDGISK